MQSAEIPQKPEFVTLSKSHYDQLMLALTQLLAAQEKSPTSKGPHRPTNEELAAEKKLPNFGFAATLVESQTEKFQVEIKRDRQRFTAEMTAEKWVDELGRECVIVHFYNYGPMYADYHIRESLRAKFASYDICVNAPDVVNTDGNPLSQLRFYKSRQEQAPVHVMSIRELKPHLQDMAEAGKIGKNEPSRLSKALNKHSTTLKFRPDVMQFDGIFLRDQIDRAYLLFIDPKYGREAAYRVLYNHLWDMVHFGPVGAEAVTQIILAHFEKAVESTPPQT